MPIHLKDYVLSDTIAAPATFSAPAALAVIRISGKNALGVAGKIFFPVGKKNLRKVPSHTLHYGTIRAKGGRVVDRVLAGVMRAPRTYTGEDVVEISGHGGVLVADEVLRCALAAGARLARPGEFTYRAFVHGRLTLAQAQGVNEIVAARSEAGLRVALDELGGKKDRRWDEVKDRLKALRVRSEACLSFPDDTAAISPARLTATLSALILDLIRLKSGAAAARIFKDGLRCVIAGSANVGKSTLFNRLLDEERVITSPVAGTTRDVVEETIIVGGVPLRIFDTAGIIDTADVVTRKAVEKSRAALGAADLVILVVDGSRALRAPDRRLMAQLEGKPVITVINKGDLAQKIDTGYFKGACVRLSALRNTGLPRLASAVRRYVNGRGVDRRDLLSLNRYQEDLLAQTLAALVEARALALAKHSFDLVHTAIETAHEAFSRLSAACPGTEILESIFSDFCIGK